MTMTYSAAAAAIRALGLKVSRTDGEIRVAWAGNESAAYYTDDAQDAYDTAIKMADEAAPERDMIATEAGDMEQAALYVIGTVAGVTYYECPKHGDEAPLQVIRDGALVDSDWYELPTEDEAAPMVERETVAT